MLGSMTPRHNGVKPYVPAAVAPCTPCIDTVGMGTGRRQLEQLGRAIRARREAAGLSQDQLAEKIGYADNSPVSRLERGQGDFPQLMLIAIATALGTTPTQLWAEAEGIEPPQVKRVPAPADAVNLLPVIQAVANALVATIPAAAEPLRFGLEEAGPPGTVLLKLLRKLPPANDSARTPGTAGKSPPRGGR